MRDELIQSLQEIKESTQAVIASLEDEDPDGAAANGAMREALIRSVVSKYFEDNVKDPRFVMELQSLEEESRALTVAVQNAMAKVIRESNSVMTQRKAVNAYDGNSQ